MSKDEREYTVAYGRVRRNGKVFETGNPVSMTPDEAAQGVLRGSLKEPDKDAAPAATDAPVEAKEAEPRQARTPAPKPAPKPVKKPAKKPAAKADKKPAVKDADKQPEADAKSETETGDGADRTPPATGGDGDGNKSDQNPA